MKESVMTHFLTSLVARLTRTPQHRPEGWRTAPQVEVLEDRLALSSTAVGGAAPGSGVALPDQPVHGYKWRRPRPWTGGTTANGMEAMPDPIVLDLRTYQPPAPVAVHLAAGGADGVQIVVTSTGAGIVPPQGPLAAKF
jgi:hypothetical protein